MDFHYPIRSAEGKAFTRPDEVYRLLAKEKHGRWLAGENGMWHGGIHVSRDAVPWSVLTKDNRDNAVPLSCIADGEVVAWRLNQDYHTASLGDAQLQYANSFLLIRAIHKPSDAPSTWLTFYVLYMQLAPLSSYPTRSVYQVTANGNGLKMRSFIGGEKTNEPAPGIIRDTMLKTGDRVLIERQETFMLRDQPEAFGLAQKIKNGVPQGKKFWTSVRSEFLELQGELSVGLPDWMSKAVEQQAFDSVVTPSQPIAIKAGDAVGYLARNDTANEKGELSTDWFTHIEVVSNDKNMPAFLGNPGKLTSGKQYIVVKDNQPLYSCVKNGDKRLFSPMNVMTQEDAGKIIAREEIQSWKDESGISWFQLCPNTWVRQEGIKEITQHDLFQLKFTALEQAPTKDVQHSLTEKWIGQAFRSLCDDLPFKRDLASGKLYDYYSQMADEIERYGEGKVSASEIAKYGDSILRGLQQRNPKVETFLRRLIVKHESEWYGGSTHPRWKSYLASLSPEILKFAKKWLDEHEWMRQVPIFNRDEPVWHFHPVEFVISLASESSDVINLEMILAANLGAKPDQCKKVLPYIKKHAKSYGIEGKKEIAHFLSQIGHESGFSILEEDLNYSAKNMRYRFGCKKGSEHYNDNTDDCDLGRLRSKLWTDEETYEKHPLALANYVYADRMGNGNEASGDGYKYRGRGMMQLTGKNGYRDFTRIHNKKAPEDIRDFVANPDLVIENIEYGVESAFAFWMSKGLNKKAKNLNVKEVTQFVNGGQNGYDNRRKRYNSVARLLKLDED